MYLPVWLYSYMQKSNGKSVLHYVAVNGRTKETMGSVPLYFKKLLIATLLVESLASFLVLFLGLDIIELSETMRDLRWVLLFCGIGLFAFTYSRYRNANKRHMHETETKYKVMNLQKSDEFKEHRTNLRNSVIEGENTRRVSGALKDNIR